MKYTTAILVAAALAAMPAAALAKGSTPSFHAAAPAYHAPTPTYHAPTPTYHAPAVVYRAPAAQYRAPATVVRTQVARPASQPRTQPRVTAVQTSARIAGTRQTVVTRRTTQSRAASPARPIETNRTSYSYGGRSYGWNSPSMMPIWWMGAMHRPYSTNAYDDFLRRCIQTPRDRRSRECVRALRERGYDY